LTLAGLAGLGDVIATCYSKLSRNHALGVALAKGGHWPEIQGTLPGVAEGAYTVTSALALADRLGVEMPIAQEVPPCAVRGQERSALPDRPALARAEGRAGGLRRLGRRGAGERSVQALKCFCNTYPTAHDRTTLHARPLRPVPGFGSFSPSSSVPEGFGLSSFRS